MALDDSGDPRRLAKLYPPEILGWKPGEADGFYTRDTLFDLIDGGAEVYRSLNVKSIVSRRYAKADGPDIIADIFDMATPPDAFGAYHHDMREGQDADVGRESEFMVSSLAFWKDRFFISIVAFDENEEVGKAVLALGRAIAGNIVGEADVPDLVKLLPAKGLVSRQVHYFHDKMLLDCYYRFGEKNILGLSSDTEGVLAHYKTDVPKPQAKKPAIKPQKKPPLPALILIRYPTKERAQAAYSSFAKQYLVMAGIDSVAKMPSGRWVGATVRDKLFIGVVDSPNKDRTLEIINRVGKPPKKNDSG